jgi:hypothetical protein
VRRAIATLASTALLFGLAGDASAHRRVYASTVTIFVTQVAATGTVQSGPSACVANREVFLSQGNTSFGSAFTDANGQWYRAGAYGLGINTTASVARFTFKKKGRRHKHMCGAAQATHAAEI